MLRQKVRPVRPTELGGPTFANVPINVATGFGRIIVLFAKLTATRLLFALVVALLLVVGLNGRELAIARSDVDVLFTPQKATPTAVILAAAKGRGSSGGSSG